MTLRSVILGLCLIPLNCYWVIVVEVRWYSMDGSCLPLFITPVFLLFCVTLVNLAIAKARPAWRLSQGELLTVYIMLVVSMTVSGHDTMQNMFGLITHPYWYAQENPSLNWPQTFFHYLPKHLLVSDLEALSDLYKGGTSAWRLSILRAWIVPLAWWTAFFVAVVVMLLCMSILVRRQWTEHERLSFPIIQLPLAMTEAGGSGGFFRSNLMWLGFAVAGGIAALNGLHQLYPMLPFVPVRYGEVRAQFRTRPWDAMGELPFSFYPFAIGLAYFLPLDLAFSCWFFYLFRKMQMVASAQFGMEKFREFPYINEQASGAWIGLALLALWGMRHYLRRALAAALGRAAVEDPQEVRRHRLALAGLAAGACFIYWFWTRAGMSPWVVLVFFGLFFLLSLAITKVRAEFGAPHEIYFVTPASMMVSVLGTDAIGPRNLTAMAMLYWMNRGYRNHPMPNQLEAFKMGERARMSTGSVVAVMLLALVASLAATYFAGLDQGYRDGAEAKSRGFKRWAGGEAFGRLQTWLEVGQDVEEARPTAMLVGFATTIVFGFLRSRYTWWWFHPTGYALGMSYAMDYFWSAFAVAWVAKLVLVRYGGMPIHRKAIPFFLGLILGDYVVGSLWAAYGPLRGFRTYKIFIAGWF